MQQAYGNKAYYLTARRGAEIVGVLTLVARRSLLFGSCLCSLPYFDAVGIIAEDQESTERLTLEAKALMEQVGADWIELRQFERIEESLDTRTDKVTLHLHLPPTSDELWKGLKAKVRNQVRKAQRAELACVQGGDELMGAFYAVYVRNMRDLGSPPHSRRFFHLISKHFSESLRIFVVMADRQPVAASLTLTDGTAVHVPWAGSDWRARRLNPNMLLYWTMLGYSCEREARLFDFGRSTLGGGTYQFKKQWGAEDVALYWHYLPAAGQTVPELRPDSPKYRLMVACWKKLPVSVAGLLGPRIIGKLS